MAYEFRNVTSASLKYTNGVSTKSLLTMKGISSNVNGQNAFSAINSILNIGELTAETYNPLNAIRTVNQSVINN